LIDKFGKSNEPAALESLIWVAPQELSAVRLNTTQPGVSLRIQQLEKELGARLFDRARRNHLAGESRLCGAYHPLVGRAPRLGGPPGDRVRRVSLGVSELLRRDPCGCSCMPGFSEICQHTLQLGF